MKPQQPLSVLPSPVISTLYDDNPWWRGERLFGLPGLRRWACDAVFSGIAYYELSEGRVCLPMGMEYTFSGQKLE